ncbi:MAG: hypothetical protein HOG49_39125 [Candidatus Scalindua sp.]|jgi:hypothetical protein|nr:hypothetical protein [Candidatus Scalindua sp.]
MKLAHQMVRFFFEKIMRSFARTTSSSSFEIIPIKRPFSMFEFVESRFNQSASLRRILSQVRLQGGKTIVVEKIDKADDLDEENEDIKKCFPAFNQSESFRLSFFTKSFSTKRGLGTAHNNEFLGYAIVKTDNVSSSPVRSKVYESVTLPSRHPNNFIRGVQKWTCNVLDNKFVVEGYLYAQQNTITNACAHVALRTVAARYHKEIDMSYREMNLIAGVDHINRKGGHGLDSTEMVRILEAAGARCFVGDYTTVESVAKSPAPFYKCLYASIESGFPAIIIFGTTTNSYHAIPVFGHTFNEDTWAPNAEFAYFKVGSGTRYIPSESWLSMFVTHDDNFGSNFCMAKNYLSTKRLCDEQEPHSILCPLGTEMVACVIATVPEKIKMDPISAEVIGADYLFAVLPQMPTVKNPWDDRLKYYANKDMLVLRTIIVTVNDYAHHLSIATDWHGKKIKRTMISALKKNLQDKYYWLIELSVPELFPANRRKVAEVLIRAEVEADLTNYSRNFKDFVIARLPGHFALYEGGGSSNPKYRFVPSGVSSHIELYGCEEQNL